MLRARVYDADYQQEAIKMFLPYFWKFACWPFKFSCYLMDTFFFFKAKCSLHLSVAVTSVTCTWSYN